MCGHESTNSSNWVLSLVFLVYATSWVLFFVCHGIPKNSNQINQNETTEMKINMGNNEPITKLRIFDEYRFE